MARPRDFSALRLGPAPVQDFVKPLVHAHAYRFARGIGDAGRPAATSTCGVDAGRHGVYVDEQIGGTFLDLAVDH